MTEKMIENRIKKLKEIEEQQKALAEQADKIREEIKQDLEAKDLEELQTKLFLIRWKEVITNRLDSKALKAAFPDIYNQFLKQSCSRRFTVA